MAAGRRFLAGLSWSLVALSRSESFEFSLEKYGCGVCREVRDGQGCELYGACAAINTSSAAGGCEAFCPSTPAASSAHHQAVGPDVRVTKGFGTKAYNQVRITVISGSDDPPVKGFFDHSAAFRNAWTSKYLHTAMKATTPGKEVKFDVGAEIDVRIPAQGAGTAGVLIADPCMSGGSVIGWVGCRYGNKYQTSKRTVELLNTFVPDPSTDYWGILGDNFYDRTGDISTDVYSRISLETKSKIFITVPGNHDYWVFGLTHLSTPLDQCAQGFMQFYAQDAKAAEGIGPGVSGSPFNFTKDAATEQLGSRCVMPALSNMFWYNQIGNVGIVGQSGAHTLEESLPLMKEACVWLSRQPGLQLAVLVGHWDAEGKGAAPHMDMPDWYEKMATLPGCKEFQERRALKYVMGHTHCNNPHPRGDVGAGFRVAAFGMEGCGNYGMPILDTTESRVRFWYFDTSSDEKYAAVIKCVRAKGWRGCPDLATLWLDEPLKAEEVLV